MIIKRMDEYGREAEDLYRALVVEEDNRDLRRSEK
jgi:hypothetical protein